MKSHESELQALLISTISGLKISMKNIMKEKGIPLSPLYFMILKRIHDTENCTANFLADVTEKDKGQITRLVKEVIEKGLVIKRPNPSDKRSQFLQLTDSGLECYGELENADKAVLKEMRSEISDEEMQLFLTVGAKMLSKLNTINHKK
jgi:DNA-binding MarR family transcriptional regulator